MITIRIIEDCADTQNFKADELYSVMPETVNRLMRGGAKFEIINSDYAPQLEKK